MKIGDRIFYQKNGEFYIDKIADIEIIDGNTIYEPKYNDWWCVTENMFNLILINYVKGKI